MRFSDQTGSARLSSNALAICLGILCALIVQMLVGPTVLAGTANGPVVKVTVIADGQEWEWVSCQTTVGGILKEAGVALEPKDRVYPSLNTKTTQGLRIRVTRIVEKIVIQKEPIKFKTTVKFNPAITGGRRIVQEGQPGEKEIKYLVAYKDGVKIGYKVLSARVITQPVNQVVVVSRPSQLASRSGSHVRRLRMIATAYDPGPRSCGKYADGYTATGMRAGHGVVAVDPRVIRLGTKLYVDGYGFCVAGDVGRAIKGNRIDLGYNTYREAIRFGRRPVTVYILE